VEFCAFRDSTYEQVTESLMTVCGARWKDRRDVRRDDLFCPAPDQIIGSIIRRARPNNGYALFTEHKMLTPFLPQNAR
jgi:hypothetical protein